MVGVAGAGAAGKGTRAGSGLATALATGITAEAGIDDERDVLDAVLLGLSGFAAFTDFAAFTGFAFAARVVEAERD